MYILGLKNSCQQRKLTLFPLHNYQFYTEEIYQVIDIFA